MRQPPKVELTKDQFEMVIQYASTFATESGKVVLEDLKKSFCGECYTKGDPYDSIYRLGQRDVVLKIAQMLRLSELPVDIVDELTSEI